MEGRATPYTLPRPLISAHCLTVTAYLPSMDPFLLLSRAAVIALAAWLWWWGRRQANENARLREEVESLRDELEKNQGPAIDG